MTSAASKLVWKFLWYPYSYVKAFGPVKAKLMDRAHANVYLKISLKREIFQLNIYREYDKMYYVAIKIVS